MSEIESGVWLPVKTTLLPWYGEDETNAAVLLYTRPPKDYRPLSGLKACLRKSIQGTDI